MRAEEEEEAAMVVMMMMSVVVVSVVIRYLHQEWKSKKPDQPLPPITFKTIKHLKPRVRTDTRTQVIHNARPATYIHSS